MSNWIDAHLHLTDSRVVDLVPALLNEARRVGITRFGLGGVEPNEWEKQKRLASLYPGVFFLSFGLHPWWVAADSLSKRIDAGLTRLREELERVPRACAAIGETGLDFHPRFSVESHLVQERVFREHLRLAQTFDIPLVLHVVRAHDRALSILREERRGASIYRGIVHSFSDGPETASSYLELGFALSISAPVITRGHGTAFEKLRQTVVTLPATALVLETDSPDQPPAGETGLNHPANLVRIAEVIAGPGPAARALLDQSAENICRIFGLENRLEK